MFPHRLERVSESVREVLAEVIHDSLKDPGMPEVFTVTHVEVSRDLRHARVGFSQLPDDAESVELTKAALDRARGYLRREVGRRVVLKYLPELNFYYDTTPRQAQRIESLLHNLVPSSGMSDEVPDEDAEGGPPGTDAKEPQP